MSVADLLARDFATISDSIHLTATTRPDHLALIQDEKAVTYAQLDALMDRIGASLQRDGLASGDVIAACASTSIEYAATFLGAVRIGVAVAPLAPSSTPESLAVMLADCGARLVFLDAAVARELEPVADQIKAPRIALDGSDTGKTFSSWLTAPGARPEPVEIDPAQPFNIIYSSGTTGAPKGIIQPHQMRWGHVRRATYGPDAVTLTSTPLYSNTTLVSFFPTLAQGGTDVLMAKFDVARFLTLAETHRVTHAMLVPVQYKRLMEHEGFGDHDLSSFVMKFCTSAPFAAELKADILARWPGGLTEIFGMTEGGGTCLLACHEHPTKLHTVGKPAEGHDIRLVGEDGHEVGPGEVGEIVGASGNMMLAYHNQPAKTAEAEWFDATGKRFIRTGDVGRFDEDGFLVLMDRKKDMIITGGFNVYPSDLEAVVVAHEAVEEVAVVGVASDRWGETPVAFVSLKPGMSVDAGALREWVNARLGKTQRLADLKILKALPRSHIGKVMKRDLRDGYSG
ncbi:class I adenylate-forming enzyme family protein [soil metagenome]